MDAALVRAVLERWKAELASDSQGARGTWEDHAITGAWKDTLMRCADDLAAALNATPLPTGTERYTAREEGDLDKTWWAVRDRTWNGRLLCRTDEASARLITSALNMVPDLLSALKIIATKGGVELDYATIGNIARAAVLRAEGES